VADLAGDGAEWTVECHDDDDAVAATAAHHVAAAARTAVAQQGHFTMAVSGGRTPWVMFAHLAHEDMPWAQTTVFQVDERDVAADSDDRNLKHLRAALGTAPATVVAMPVDDADIEYGARDYAAQLPPRIDLVHLGLGPDGHTASLVPGDPILEVTDRAVAVTTGEYQGCRRMSLTYPTLDAASQVLWLVTGAEKARALSQLLDHDRSIPAGRVRAPRNLVLTDRAALPEA
jgi:6-phosphogluconolactonase